MRAIRYVMYSANINPEVLKLPRTVQRWRSDLDVALPPYTMLTIPLHSSLPSSYVPIVHTPFLKLRGQVSTGWQHSGLASGLCNLSKGKLMPFPLWTRRYSLR